MQSPIAREASNIALVGALFVVGSALGGPVGGAVGGVAGEMLAEVTERGWISFRDRFLGDRGMREPDLQAAMRRSYMQAINDLERDWVQVRSVEIRSSQVENGGVQGL